MLRQSDMESGRSIDKFCRIVKRKDASALEEQGKGIIAPRRSSAQAVRGYTALALENNTPALVRTYKNV